MFSAIISLDNKGNKDNTFQSNFQRYYKDLFALKNEKFSNDTKLTTAAMMIQSLGFKYILDLADEQPEIENDVFCVEDDSPILAE
jgi:hypothetical protein